MCLQPWEMMGVSSRSLPRAWHGGPAAVSTKASVLVVSVWGAWHPSGTWGVLPWRASCHLLARQAWAQLRMRRFGARAGGLRTATSHVEQDGDANGGE